jgi:hypothetical protein
VSLSRDDWSAWTGGKPAPGWVGLDPSAADDITSPNQLRPVHASASRKEYNFRRTSMTTLLTQANSLVDFQNLVLDNLTNCGMDTIAYLSPILRTRRHFERLQESLPLHRCNRQDSQLPASSPLQQV